MRNGKNAGQWEMGRMNGPWEEWEVGRMGNGKNGNGKNGQAEDWANGKWEMGRMGNGKYEKGKDWEEWAIEKRKE